MAEIGPPLGIVLDNIDLNVIIIGLAKTRIKILRTERIMREAV